VARGGVSPDAKDETSAPPTQQHRG
jgi:hypothetical protein